MASIRKRIWTREVKEEGPGGKPKVRTIEMTAWVVDYFDQGGKRHLKTFATKKEAETWATTALYEVKQGIHTPAVASLTVAAAAERWVSQGEAEGLEFGTIRQRQQHVERHIKPFLGREKLSELTMPRINQFVRELRDNGRSIAMRRKVLTSLKTMLSYSQGEGLVAQNVAREVKVKSDDRHSDAGPLRPGVDFPSMAELKTMMDRAPDRWRALIVTAIFTGMRESELRGLRWEDVDLEGCVLHVRQRADAWGTMGPPKSKAGKREIPLAPIVVNTLSLWRAVCPKRESEDSSGSELYLVFPNGAGNVEGYTNIIRRFFDPLQLACAITVDTGEIDEKGKPITRAKYSLHAIRHAAASLFIAYLGWTPKRVQAVMGHSSIQMTFDLYGGLFEDREADRKAMKRLEAAVSAA